MRLYDKDRRNYQRLDFSVAVMYRIREPLIARIVIGDMESPATMLNLSRAGMAIVAEYNIPELTVLDLSFRLSRMDREGNVTFYGPMKLKGEVRSNVCLGNKEYRLGICFTGIDQKAAQELERFFAENK